MNDFKVAYNNVFRRFFHVPRHVNGVTVSVSGAQAEFGIPTAANVVCRLGESLYHRIISSENQILSQIIDTDMFGKSSLVNKWRSFI